MKLFIKIDRLIKKRNTNSLEPSLRQHFSYLILKKYKEMRNDENTQTSQLQNLLRYN